MVVYGGAYAGILLAMEKAHIQTLTVTQKSLEPPAAVFDKAVYANYVGNAVY